VIALLRHAEAGYGGRAWRPAGEPGAYVCRDIRDGRDIAARISQETWAESATFSNGYITVSLTHDALAHVAVDVARAGPGCVASDALSGRVVPAAPRADLAAAPDWAAARAALAAELTVALAVRAGATLAPGPPAAPAGETRGETTGETTGETRGETTGRYEIASAIAFAGEQAVRFTLARTKPAGPAPEPEFIARHVLGNPAYAVRYAHAAAAAVLRWAGTQPGEFRPHQLAEPGELALLDALSWLPERVAVAAGRGRPDEFARYLETLAWRTIDIISTTAYKAATGVASERLWLADAARTGLAAGLGLLGIAPPDRL